MKAFELPAGTRLKMIKATPRKEVHGDDLVQAISLRLRWETTNEALAKLDPNLLTMLYWRSPELQAQAPLEGIDQPVPNLRVHIVEMPMKLDTEHSGYTLTIEHGIDDSTALQLYVCDLGKFAIDAKEGGTIIIDWTVRSSKSITPELVGALCDLEGSEIAAELVAPALAAGTIDGSTEAFRRDHRETDDERDATDLFTAQHGGDAGGDDRDGPTTSDDIGAEQGNQVVVAMSGRQRRAVGAVE